VTLPPCTDVDQRGHRAGHSGGSKDPVPLTPRKLAASLRTGPGAGVVRFDSVEPVDPATLTEDDAARAGVRSLAALLKLLDRRLDRLDTARGTPWTREVLALIAARPGVLLLTHSLAVGYEISPRGRAYLG
jgi:hypothetical protein